MAVYKTITVIAEGWELARSNFVSCLDDSRQLCSLAIYSKVTIADGMC